MKIDLKLKVKGGEQSLLSGLGYDQETISSAWLVNVTS